MFRQRLRAAAAVTATAVVLAAAPAPGVAGETPRKFDLGPGRVAPGYTAVAPDTVYDSERGYGFDLDSKSVKAVERGGGDPLRDAFCTSDAPFFFSVDVPEGNYNVTLTLGDRDGESVTTVKAESRRLMLERVRTKAGEVVTRTFTVNTRNGRGVRLKEREKGVLHWDDKLTLEFSDTRPCVSAVEIAPAPDAVTVFLAGDSTVTDQPREPWNSWGQMLPRFFKPSVAVANHAESGESLKSFNGSKRTEKVLGSIKAGDYLLIQFGHNDQKDKSPGAGADTTYTAALKRFIDEARKKGATPVLVTPVNRRSFGKDGAITNSLGGFPDAVRRLAKEEGLTLIDLNAMSRPFYEALGPEGSKKAFVEGDNTHHNNYGSYELARCVVEGIRRSPLGLAKSLADDVKPFDPAHPDPLDQWSLPASPQRTTVAPEGR